MKKKLLITLLVLAMAFSSAACTSSKNTSKTDKTEKKATESVAESVTETSTSHVEILLQDPGAGGVRADGGYRHRAGQHQDLPPRNLPRVFHVDGRVAVKAGVRTDVEVGVVVAVGVPEIGRAHV